MKQPRNITVSRVFVGVMIVLALFFANVLYRKCFGRLSHEIMRGVFTPRIGFPYRLQFIVPVLLAVLVAVILYNILHNLQSG